MKLIFTSYGFQSPVVCDKLRDSIDTDGKRMFIIPCAGFDSIGTGAREKKAAVRFGFEENKVYIFDEACPEVCKGMVFDYVYVSGGDPFKLLSAVRKYGLNETIKRCRTYIGVSAGAYIACGDIEYVKLLEDDDYIFDDYIGLGLFNGRIICHYDLYGSGVYSQCRMAYPDGVFYTLENGQAAVVEKNEWEYI